MDGVLSDRAEDLNASEVFDLFVELGNDSTIVDRLMAPGAHLLQGSRGTGKTMLLRVAHERIRRERHNVLPVFISFSRYLATTHPGANISEYSPFESWVIAKLFQSVLLASGNNGHGMMVAKVPLENYIKRLESHYRDPQVSDRAATAHVLGVNEGDLVEFARLDMLVDHIHALLDNAKYSSVTFLLDEAAQNFAEELQPLFFRIIRHLRDSRIAIKVAVYPNTTFYGREFDVGHDAVVLPIERRIEESESMPFFREFIKRRTLNTDLGNYLGGLPVQRDFLIKMSGGNPRWLLHLLSRVETKGESLSTQSILSVAKEFPSSTLYPYLDGLKARLKSKRRYIEAAVSLSQIFSEDLRAINREKAKERPACYVAVSQSKELPYRIKAGIGLLEYVGILFRRGPRRITSRENAQTYLLHPLLLVKENCLFPNETNPSVDNLLKSLTDPAKEEFKEYTKNSPRLLADVSPEVRSEACDNCGQILNEGANFCYNCGFAVAKQSLFEELRSASSSELELTPGIKQLLNDDGRFQTVGSVLDATDEQLDSIYNIGRSRLKIIRSAAEEFVAG